MAMRQDSEDGVELTEKLVLTRTRAPDLDSVRKLNCWASNISDVSVVRKLPNLEVCSLSINRITSLRDFAHCYKLKELYVRTNKISCLGDIHYLKSLSRLRYLWLSENPCADADNYRLTVLRVLPRLQKLDNTAVTYDEVQEALSTVNEIAIPDDFSASSVFNRPLNISSVSSVSSVSLDGVVSPRASHSHSHPHATDVNVSPREGGGGGDGGGELPMARRKREKRRQKKAEEDSARRSAEEEFVRTSLVERNNRAASGRSGGGGGGGKERKHSSCDDEKVDGSVDEEDYDDDDEVDDDDDNDTSNETVSDDIKASTDSEKSGPNDEGKRNSSMSDEDLICESVDCGGGGGGGVDKNDEGGGEGKRDGGVVNIFSNDIVTSQSDKIEDYSNKDNDSSSNSDAFDRSEIILESFNGDEKDNCININNNNNNDQNKYENYSVSKKEEQQEEEEDEGEKKDCNSVIEKGRADNVTTTSVAGDSLLDKIRLDDSLAVDENEAGLYDPSHDSIELDDLVVEVAGEENHQTLTNDVTLCNSSAAEKRSDDNNDDDDGGGVGSSNNQSDNNKKEKGDCNEKSVEDFRLDVDPSVAATSSPRAKLESETNTAAVSSHKDSVDWERYNRMRQDIGMKPIERGATNPRPLSANVSRARNGNILQAVLSLVKELDKDSLELVASAVKVRMDSL